MVANHSEPKELTGQEEVLFYYYFAYSAFIMWYYNRKSFSHSAS